MADYDLKTITPDTDGPASDNSVLFGADDQTTGTPKPYSWGGVKSWIKSWIVKADVGLGSVANVDTTNASNISSGTLPVARMSLVSAFSVNKNGTDQTGIVSATFTQVTFGTEVYDVGNNFASSAWTPPAGKVTMSAGVSYSGTITAGSNCQIRISKNGALLYQVAANPFTNAGGALISGDDIANGADVYTISVYITTSAGTATASGTVGLTYFTGHYISP